MFSQETAFTINADHIAQYEAQLQDRERKMACAERAMKIFPSFCWT